ncbi:DNA-binding MarR family transcriptional regulator [Asanoa ferruginea]|uniref:DNA-binding MarR family transcriptional regulator n=1 Tax=Asanoa ferruginea TaxID=53367 RepID=A0A3D9ZR30_9ACTN|nr:MarR family transcriptional regulator [Asanoa ferruginea]REF99685.1 DNA-binding MarR family transcriptional regulator [Asanoa ferruginea]GIF50394.1 hypothetical protein Afe04nite_49330 [Asanoa ferruginea]
MNPAGDSATRGEESPPPYAAGAQLGWALAVVKRVFYDQVADSVRDLPGGPRGYLMLAALSLGRRPSQLALANQLGLDRTVVTYLLDELEAAGLVERRPDPSDRRARQVLITDAGSVALTEYSNRVGEDERRLLAPLTAAEAAAFSSMITRVARAAQNGPDAGGICPATDC